MRPIGDDAVPERCDGCGQAAQFCGMLNRGWTVRTEPAGFAGSYCQACAEALHLLPWSIRCTECGLLKADEAAADRAGFLYYADGLGVFCPIAETVQNGGSADGLQPAPQGLRPTEWLRGAESGRASLSAFVRALRRSSLERGMYLVAVCEHNVSVKTLRARGER